MQSSLAVQKLQGRLTSLERSSGALRELLHQRLGASGLMELVDSLQRMGAGEAALLETPAHGDADEWDAASGAGTKVVASSPGTAGRSKQLQQLRGTEPTSAPMVFSSPSSVSGPPPSRYHSAIDRHIHK